MTCPRTRKMMNRIGMLVRVNLTGLIRLAREREPVANIQQRIFFAYAHHDFWQRQGVERAVSLYETSALIIIKARPYERVFLFRAEASSLYAAPLIVLIREHHVRIQQVVERPERLDVHVKVDAAVMVHRVQADVVGGEGIFLAVERLRDPL